jgi:hypothetical protein
VLDDVFHRVTQTTGRIHGDEDEIGVTVRGVGEAFADVRGEDGSNFAV